MKQKTADSLSDIPPDIPPAPEVIYVATHDVACDGSAAGPGMGHPKVFLKLRESAENSGSKTWSVTCPYCDAEFIYDPKKANAQ